VWEGEYGRSITYSLRKMEKWDLWKLFQEWGEWGGLKENYGRVNSVMIYCKDFGKCHNVPSVQQW
jgi:hypothetical protein